MDRRDLLKPSRFGNAEKRRLLDSKNLKEKRSLRRTTNFNLHRQISTDLDPHNNENVHPKNNKLNDRKIALQKFKAEKEAQRKAFENRKKPPFVVGIPHHGSSPLLRNLTTTNTNKREIKTTANEVRSKIVTRATATTIKGNVLKEKIIINEQPRKIPAFKAPPSVKVFPFRDNKTVFKFLPKLTQSDKKLTSPQTPTVLKRSVQKKPLKLALTNSKLQRNTRRSLGLAFSKELASSSTLKKEVKEESKETSEIPENTLHISPGVNQIEPNKGDEVIKENLDSTLTNEVAFQQLTNSKLQRNTRRSLGLAFSKELASSSTVKKEVKEESKETSEIPENTLHISPGVNKIEPTKDDEVIKENLDSTLTNEVAFQQLTNSKLQRNTRRSLRQAHSKELASSSTVKKEVKEESKETSEIPENTLHISPGVNKIEPNKGDEVIKENLDSTLTNEVAFQHGRLQTETERLLELAEQWQTVALKETLPEDVVDEVDCLVGQTRLLTGDKFQQFRRLVVQYEQRTETHIITLDDLNGFWDMVYLQVEALDKRYAALYNLRNNNWIKPEPERKKKRGPTKKKSQKVTESSNPIVQDTLSAHPEGEQVQTPSTSVKPIISSVLLHRKRTRSNSPSPYIAMRLSVVGKTSNIMINSPSIDLTPRSKMVSLESYGTPKSAHKNSWKILTESTKKRRSLLSTASSTTNTIEEHVADEEQPPVTVEPLPAMMTPRRSMRLMSKITTPASCATCDFKKSECSSRRRSRRTIPPVQELLGTISEPDCGTDGSTKTSCSKKALTFSPSNSSLATELPQSDMEGISKPTMSRVRFSLRPSVLTISESSINETSSKVAKRKQTSVHSASTMPTERESQTRRSTRQSRKVTFESEVGEKVSLKLPATPYRKSQADS